MRNAVKRCGTMAIMVMVVATLGLTTTATAEEDNSQTEGEAVSEADETVWEFTARVRPRAEARFNYHFGLPEEALDRQFQPDQIGLFTQQTRLGAGVEHGDLSAQLTLQHAAQWGQFGGPELTTPPLALYRGWMSYEPSDRVALDLGRFELAYGAERVLGSVGWSQVGRAWDGVRTRVRPGDDIDVDLFAARYDEQDIRFFEGDSYLTGIYASAAEPLGDVVDAAELYLLYDLQRGRAAEDIDGVDQDDPMAADRRHLAMLGTRWAISTADFDASAEVAGQLGSHCAAPEEGFGCDVPTRTIRAYFADLEAGYQIGTARPFVGFSIAPGDDPDTDTLDAYQEMYPTGHAYLGFMDLIGPRTNVMEFRGGAQSQFDGFRSIFAVHDFYRLQPDADRLGTELNLKIFVDVTDAFEVGAGHGIFIPGDGMSTTDEQPEGVANWSFVQAVGAF